MREGWIKLGLIRGCRARYRYPSYEIAGDHMIVRAYEDGTYEVWPMGPSDSIAGLRFDSDDDAMAYAETLSALVEK